MVLNSLSFCFSVKLLISPSYLNEILAGYSHMCCRFFFHQFKYVLQAIPVWPGEFLLKDQLLFLRESPCVLFVVFHLLFLIFIFCVGSLLI